MKNQKDSKNRRQISGNTGTSYIHPKSPLIVDFQHPYKNPSSHGITFITFDPTLYGRPIPIILLANKYL
jgi:hypothetical protein